jgi:hypothetical protein
MCGGDTDGASMANPGLSTIKTVWAHSYNRCAFPGCDNRLTDPLPNGVRADPSTLNSNFSTSNRFWGSLSDRCGSRSTPTPRATCRAEGLGRHKRARSRCGS